MKDLLIQKEIGPYLYRAKNGGKYARGYWINAELQIHNEHGIEMYSYPMTAQQNELELTMYNDR